MTEKPIQVLEENLVKIISRLNPYFSPSHRCCLLCLCNLMLWKKNLMFVSQKESTEVNAIRVFITDTLFKQAWTQTLYNSSLASQCGTTTVESGHFVIICAISCLQSVCVNCIFRWTQRVHQNTSTLGHLAALYNCATFAIVTLSINLHLGNIWHEHWPSDWPMLMRPWKKSCAINCTPRV